MIGLVDGNNFYVSCERIFDLTLENKPVAILSNNDGCVISRSYEFKALNIPMGAPYFKLRDHKNIIMRSSNYELYGDISRRLIATLHEFTPDVEQYSIDEAFIHLNLPLGGDYSKLGKQVRQTVLQWVGIPCGIGFAQSKTLAKIANHIAKKESSGVFVMPDDKQSVLDELHVSEVWDVGKRL
ncbi:MAG: DNA polymerase V subunit UmuC, partial [Victivallaceae bacterium]|nr:DNA polymerase V subunit UmuC [Victivallaceae bacterium]